MPSSSAAHPGSGGRAPALAAEGCRITIADVNADGARSRAAELGAQHVGAYVDVTDEDSVAAPLRQRRPARHRRELCGVQQFRPDHGHARRGFPRGGRRCLNGSMIVMKHAGSTCGKAARWCRSVRSTPGSPRRDERLLRGQGRSVDADPGGRPGDGAARHPGQRRGPRVRSHPADRGGRARHPGWSRTMWTTPRSAGRAPRRTSPMRLSTCAVRVVLADR